MSDRQTQSAGDDARDVRLGQILDDYLSRRSRGEMVTESELLAQHPDLADELRDMLATVRDLRPASDRIGALIKQGVLDRSKDPRYLAELGSYRITGYIGRGGMGIVLKAYEESLNRTVALKILRPELEDDPVALKRLIREAKAAAGLQHPNIVTVHAVGQERGAHYIAMEYVDGPSLADVVREHGPLPPEIVRNVFRQVLSALAAAHDVGLIHRDVKSSNILLELWPRRRTGTEGAGTPQAEVAPATQSSIVNLQPAISDPRTLNPEAAGGVKLADFGLARMLTAETRVTLGDTALGTPEYMRLSQNRDTC